jgi:hypothetical protein
LVRKEIEIVQNDITFVSDHYSEQKQCDNVLNKVKELLSYLMALNMTYQPNDSTIMYYAHDITYSGKQYIVAKMNSNKNHSELDIIKNITNDEIDFQIKLSHFVNNLSRGQQKEFGTVLEHLHNIYVTKTIVPICRLPQSYNDMRKLYLDNELAINSYLPIPTVNMIDETHSVVSLKDIIADYLFRSTNIDVNINNWLSITKSLDNDMNLFNCKQVKQIVEAAKKRIEINQCQANTSLPTVVLFLSFWSDDFDPNKSIKSNRQSVWIKTATIFTMTVCGTKSKITYPISFSYKGRDHEPVEALHSKELRDLQYGSFITMYSRSHKSVVNVHAELFCVMNDQPERRSNLNLTAGNSLIHGRFGYILNCKNVYQYIRSCESCSNSIILEAAKKMESDRDNHDLLSNNLVTNNINLMQDSDNLVVNNNNNEVTNLVDSNINLFNNNVNLVMNNEVSNLVNNNVNLVNNNVNLVMNNPNEEETNLVNNNVNLVNNSVNLVSNKEFSVTNNDPVFNHEWRSTHCSKCSAWMYHMSHKLLYYSPDKSIPTKLKHKARIGDKFKPMAILREDINEGINLVTDELMKGQITVVEARSYLKSLGMDGKCVETAIKLANQNLKYKLPSSWYGNNNLQIFVEAPMHLLMLGVMKNVMLRVNQWLRYMNQNASFLRLVQGKLNMIKSLNIEWCKVLEYPQTDTTGGWVSENFAAMARIGVYFYSYLLLLPMAEDYSDPTTHHTTWNKSQNEWWLQMRDIKNDGTALELKKKVANYFDTNTIPPLMKTNSIGVKDIIRLVQSTCYMIKMLMSVRTTSIDIPAIEAVIRVYLIHYDIVDSAFATEKRGPSWVNSYNMLCLLNIPEMLRTYGHIRNVWEGGKEGESYLRQVKANMKAGLVHCWQKWVLTNLLKQEIFDEWNITKKDIKLLANEVRIYPTYKHAKDNFNSGRPISSLYLNGRVYICYRRNKSTRVTRIELERCNSTDEGLKYYSLKWTNKTKKMNANEINFVGMLLLPKPELITKNVEDTVYCYIRSDWSE